MAVTGSLQEKNGYYYAVLNLYDEKGKRKPKWTNTWLPVKGGNKRKAENFLNNQIAEWNAKDVPYCKMTFAEYLVEWLKEIEPEVKKTTYRSYQGNMENHIIP